MNLIGLLVPHRCILVEFVSARRALLPVLVTRGPSHKLLVSVPLGIHLAFLIIIHSCHF
jgi:hypothetical protein